MLKRRVLEITLESVELTLNNLIKKIVKTKQDTFNMPRHGCLVALSLEDPLLKINQVTKAWVGDLFSMLAKDVLANNGLATISSRKEIQSSPYGQAFNLLMCIFERSDYVVDSEQLIHEGMTLNKFLTLGAVLDYLVTEFEDYDEDSGDEEDGDVLLAEYSDAVRAILVDSYPDCASTSVIRNSSFTMSMTGCFSPEDIVKTVNNFHTATAMAKNASFEITTDSYVLSIKKEITGDGKASKEE